MRCTLLGVGLLAVASLAPLAVDCRKRQPGEVFHGDRLALAGKPVLEKGGSLIGRCKSYAPDKSGTRCVDLFFFVFPVVREGTAPDAPVPMWISCPGAETLEACAERVKQADYTSSNFKVTSTVQPTRKGDGWNQAIGDAETKHGLRSAPYAPVVVYDPKRR